MWAAGIIMYILISGKHPISRRNETAESYAEKVGSGKFEFTADFSEYLLRERRLARDFFTRLCNVDLRSRYSAAMALKHPWITRKFESEIPLTIYDEDIEKQTRKEFLNAVRAVFFLSQPRVLRRRA